MKIVNKIKILVEKVTRWTANKNILDKIVYILVHFLSGLQIIIVLMIFVFVFWTTNSILKGLVGCLLIIILIILLKSLKLLKQVRKEIGNILDNSEVKKELLFYLMLYTFIMLITVNISLFVFFWLQHYVYNTLDPLELKTIFIWLFNIIGWNNVVPFYIRIMLVLGTLGVYIAIVKPYSIKKVYKSKEKRTEEEKLIDHYMIYYAKQIPKEIRIILKYNVELNILWLLSVILLLQNKLLINILGFIICFAIIIIKILIEYYVSKFEDRLYNYLWYISYNPNPDPDQIKIAKNIKKYNKRTRRVIKKNVALNSTSRNLRRLGLIGGISGGIFGTIFAYDNAWSYLWPEEESPVKINGKKLGKIIRETTGYPKPPTNEK